jgi:hypothetical protein
MEVAGAAVLSRHSFGAKTVGAVSSAIAVHVTSRRRFSFLRYAYFDKMFILEN